MEPNTNLDPKRQLVRALRRCTPPTDQELARRCLRAHCPWRRDGVDICVLPRCKNRGGM